MRLWARVDGGHDAITTATDYFSTVACFPAIPTTSVRAYCSRTLGGTRQTSVPINSTQYPIQIQVTSGNT